MRHNDIIFLSTTLEWGASEELWSQTAIALAGKDIRVVASVHRWPIVPARLGELEESGVETHRRFLPWNYPLWKKAFRRLAFNKTSWDVLALRNFTIAKSPALVVLSDGGFLPPVDLVEYCDKKKFRFVTISHSNFEGWWPVDEVAERYRNALPSALRCYFVSQANLRLVEKQIGCELPNAEVIKNPFNVSRTASPTWPPLGENHELKLASVARLHPPSKGQDILFEALSQPIWRTRNWRLRLYGMGPSKETLERLARRLRIDDRVEFMGHISNVEDIWAQNHALVLPSRFEGLPLTIVEAMFCGRPVIATTVGGLEEIIDDGVTGFLAAAPTANCMSEALERAWSKRTFLEQMGREASVKIRKFFPKDPIAEFSQKLRTLAGIG